MGIASVMLGAGRETKDDTIDMSAGIILKKKNGDLVHKGDTIATLYSCNNESFAGAEKRFLSALQSGKTAEIFAVGGADYGGKH